MPMSSPAATTRPWWRLIAGVLLIALLWELREPLLLFFGAVLVAATLCALASPLTRRTGLGRRPAVLAVTLLMVLLVAGGLWWLGDPLAEQLHSLQGTLPKAWQALKAWLQGSALGQRVLESIGGLSEAPLPWAGIAGLATGAFRGAGAALLMLLMGIYLALDVRLYRDGLLRLLPAQRRVLLGDTLDAAGEALTRWLVGQGVTMVAVGVAVAVGLGLLGMPLALALGVIAGLLEFVPFIGPIAAGLLAVLVAFGQGPTQALYVAAFFVVLQQVENHILVPLVQRWAVALPPVLTLAGVVVFGTLFGPLGVVFGTPLMVVAVVLVQRLYVEQAVDKPG
ncbi:AI-2E family transporter [Ideonella sp. BN130291]|uniref:AI-2E family transporter n=1 Tax=Ideonella sp. BN130291 TaxID=3112940 RepID=UPI002E25490B|nr:AI-2E family transporter [Ideonella sp. BN130291]